MNNRPEPPQRGDNKDPKNAPSGSPIPNAQRIWLAVGAFVLLLFLLMIVNGRGNSFGGTDALSYPDLARCAAVGVVLLPPPGVPGRPISSVGSALGVASGVNSASSVAATNSE